MYCIYILTYIYIYILTYIHIYIYASPPPGPRFRLASRWLRNMLEFDLAM